MFASGGKAKRGRGREANCFLAFTNLPESANVAFDVSRNTQIFVPGNLLEPTKPKEDKLFGKDEFEITQQKLLEYFIPGVRWGRWGRIRSLFPPQQNQPYERLILGGTQVPFHRLMNEEYRPETDIPREKEFKLKVRSPNYIAMGLTEVWWRLPDETPTKYLASHHIIHTIWLVLFSMRSSSLL